MGKRGHAPICFTSVLLAAFAGTGRDAGGTERGYPRPSLSDRMGITVATAPKPEEALGEAPNLMRVMGEDEIRRRGYGSFKGIFRVAPGFGVDHEDIRPVGQVRGIAPNGDLSRTSRSGEAAPQHTVPDRDFTQPGVPVVEKPNHNHDFRWDPDRPHTFYRPNRGCLGKVKDPARLDKMRSIVDASETHAMGVLVCVGMAVSHENLRVSGSNLRVDLRGVVRSLSDNPLLKGIQRMTDSDHSPGHGPGDGTVHPVPIAGMPAPGTPAGYPEAERWVHGDVNRGIREEWKC